MQIIYATKAWKEDIPSVFSYHPNAQLIIGNNLGFDFVDMGSTDEPYFAPEYKAIYEADKRGGYPHPVVCL